MKDMLPHVALPFPHSGLSQGTYQTNKQLTYYICWKFMQIRYQAHKLQNENLHKLMYNLLISKCPQ